MKRTLFVGLVLAAAVYGCRGTRTEEINIPSITPAESARFLGHDTSYVFFDVRTIKEFRSETGHLLGAINIPVDSLESRLSDLDTYKSKTIIAYCLSGIRSRRAQKFLSEEGFHVLSMLGGINGWIKEELPVVKEPQ